MATPRAVRHHAPMISGLKIGNFKAFGPAQEIPLRPLTLVFGPNSAGKSSIIQSLQLARHIQDTGNVDAHQTTLGGAAVDLGGFGRYVYKRETNRSVLIQLSFLRSNIAGIFTSLDNFEELRASFTIATVPPKPPNSIPSTWVAGVSFHLDDREVIRLTRNSTGDLELDDKHLLSTIGIQPGEIFRRELAVVPLDSSSERTSRDRLIAEYNFVFRSRIERENSECFSLRGLSVKNPMEYPAKWSNCGLDPERDAVAFFQEFLENFHDERHEWRKEAICASGELLLSEEASDEAEVSALVLCDQIGRLIDGINGAIHRALNDVCYLGPLRWIPPRLIPDGEQFDASWKAGGGDAWQRLRREPELLDRVNHFLRDVLCSRYRLECQRFALVKPGAASDSPRVAEDPPQTATPRVSGPDETITALSIVDAESGLTISHRDVGTGISQLLPVLVNAAGSKERLIMIEQPELHLHPALQAELGDVFIESALGENKNTFLIETHSEHLILRIMRRIRESNAGRQPTNLPAVKPEDVAILFVQPTDSGSVVKHLRLDERGRLMDDWPGGFFEESFDELF
jgi:hypothetical protein